MNTPKVTRAQARVIAENEIAVAAIDEDMNARAEIRSAITIVEAEPSKALTAHAVFVQFKAELEKEVDAHVPDLTTEKGRKAIASLAFRVTKAKTSIDAAGKKLIEDARKMVDTVNAERKTIREELDALADRARKPLTDWEVAEAVRSEAVVAGLAKIGALGNVSVDDTSETITARIVSAREFVIDPSLYREMEARAIEAKTSAITALENGLARIIREEADRAELARLRAEAEARDIAERARIAAEQEAKAEADRIQAEAAAKARREADEAARVAAIEERARREALEAAESKAREEQDAKDRAHREEIARLEREKAETEAKAKAEAARVQAEKDAAEAEARRVADENASRAADKAHRGEVMRAAKEAIMEFGDIDEPKAKAIVLAIVSGSVPHTSIQF